MACRGCGKKRVDLPKPEAWTLKEESEVTTGQWPLLEFIGTATSDMRFNGKSTKRKYTFAANDYHRYKRVHPDDAPHLLRSAFFKQIDSIPTGGQQDKRLIASPVPVQTEVVERIGPPVSPPSPALTTTLPFPIPPTPVKVVEPNIPIPDFATLGSDYQTATPVESVDMAELTVSKVMKNDWTPDEIRSIYQQELASVTPRVTIVKWAEKELEKLNELAE